MRRLALAVLLLFLPALAQARTYTVSLSAATSTLVMDNQGARTWARVTNIGATNPATCSRTTPATATNGHVLATAGNTSTSVIVYPADSVPGQALYCFSTSGTTLYVETAGDHGPTPTPVPTP